MTASTTSLQSQLVSAQVPAVVRELEEEACFSDTPRLTRALRAGDEAAFRWLHAHWNDRLCRYCFALAAGNDAFARDVAQATYLRVLRHIRELPDETALWRWLACAASSAACDLRRAGGRYQRALARFFDLARFGQSPREEPPAESTLVSALEAALIRLAEDERRLIDARYFQQLSLSEIASRFGTSERAIEGRLARLRSRLREVTAATLRREEHPS